MSNQPIIPSWEDPSRWDQPPDLFTEAENARLEAAGYRRMQERRDGVVSWAEVWLTPDGRHITREQALRRLDAESKRED